MKAGLIGFGSIGKRHVNNLLELGVKEITLMRDKGRGNEHGLKEVYDFDTFLESDFDFVIVSNPTTFHAGTLKPLIRNNMNLLVEKPLVYTPDEYSELKEMLTSYTGKGMIAYNMRFHPCIVKVKEILEKKITGDVYSARLFVGQYLPEWRPGTDYRTGVSALKELGGGVVLELIHEIDLALYLFGKPVTGIFSFAGKSSSLEIETEDISEILWRSEGNTIVSVHQDYLSRDYMRYIELVGEKGTLFCDLGSPEITIKGPAGKLIFHETFSFERNVMYFNLMKYYVECISNDIKPVPSLADSLESTGIALEVKMNNNLL